jgi:1,4-alpha-glucan branching enzyme
MKNLSIVLYLIIGLKLLGQNAIVGTGFSDGWGGSTCPTGNTNFNFLGASFGGSFGGTKTPTGSGNRYFRMGIAWDMTTAQRTINIGSDVAVIPNVKYNLNSSCTTSGAMFINVPSTAYRYTFKTRNAGTNPTGEFICFATIGNPTTVSSVISSPNTSNVSSTQAVLVKALVADTLPAGQGVYLRYTTNNWTSSTTLPMSYSTGIAQATIPAQAIGTTVNYYVFTSGNDLTISSSDVDFFTINANTNSGTNYSYQVSASPIVTVTPALPFHNDSVKIVFNAAGSALATATKIYLHAGVGTVANSPQSFSVSKGNWGQDDGIGQMTQVPGEPNKWEITLRSSLRDYFQITNEKDVFGLNFLFRNETGATKEDNNGNNYHYAVNPGNYFTLISPANLAQVIEVGSNIIISAYSANPVTSWILQDSTTAIPTTVYTQNGGNSFSYTITYPDATTRRYRLYANYADVSKYKTFNLTGYNAVNVAPRPSWVKPGINYHNDDSTKATLVLHAPTYTRYKKGTGTITGNATTPPKNIVHVIGDFNNWTPSESNKMKRDRDGWNGTTDSDNDDDRGDYWWITLENLQPKREYVFQYLIDGVLQIADPYSNKISDVEDQSIPSTVYPGLINYPPQANDRASVLQTDQDTFTWEAPSFIAPSNNNLHIYEMHFRDFTDESTYTAAIEKLDYIKGLGINAVHVLPVSEFEGNSSWGYNPNFYFAADKAYGPANLLKKFIDECHKKQILVFNDLVLNHTFYSNAMAKMYWNSTLNRPDNLNPWLNPTHKMVRNTAGHWGADWNHESEHTQLMVDSIIGYWLSEYKFDGFRFDFTKGFGQTNPEDFPPGDDWASAYNQDRVDLLKRMVNKMWQKYPNSVAIFEHLATSSEDKVLADHGILMWSGVGHHNAVKNFILGYAADNPDIYQSGYYNALGRNFTFANWMSYPESHDEERLAYELFQNFNGIKNTTNVIDRLKLAYGFNLLLPGPRMLWQFGELGYDVSINFNGRTGEKPVRWEYYTDAKRKELYNLISRILKLRSKVNLFGTTPDYGNINFGANAIDQPRVMRLSSPDNKHAIVVGNLDPNNPRNVAPNFDVTGTWYRYNGVLDESEYVVTNANQNSTYTLQPSEFILFTNVKIDRCNDVRSIADSGPYTLRNAVDCASEGDTVNIEYPVFGQIISLNSPISLNKNLYLKGFQNSSIEINGTTLSSPLFTIMSGKTVHLNGMKIICASGNIDGRCIVNSGHLHLQNIEVNDGNFPTGSSILNSANGTLIINKGVSIK